MGRRSRANASRAAEGLRRRPGRGPNATTPTTARAPPNAGGGRRRAAEQTRAGPGERTKHRDARFGRPRARRPVSSASSSPAELIIGRAVFGGATTRPNFGVWRGPRPVGNKIAPPRGPRRQSTPARPSSRTPGVVSPSSPYVVARAVSALRRARLRGRGEVGRPRDRALPPAERRRRAVGTPSRSGELPELSELHTYAGLVVTGSHHGANDDEPWIDATRRFLAEAVDRGGVASRCSSTAHADDRAGGRRKSRAQPERPIRRRREDHSRFECAQALTCARLSRRLRARPAHRLRLEKTRPVQASRDCVVDATPDAYEANDVRLGRDGDLVPRRRRPRVPTAPGTRGRHRFTKHRTLRATIPEEEPRRRAIRSAPPRRLRRRRRGDARVSAARRRRPRRRRRPSARARRARPLRR